jgi:hypothetical protein
MSVLCYNCFIKDYWLKDILQMEYVEIKKRGDIMSTEKLIKVTPEELHELI